MNTRESRSDPDRLAGCTACSQSNLVPETVDHVFQCTASTRRKAIIDRFVTFSDHFQSMKTSQLILSALQMGALAWIEQRDPPTVEILRLPNNALGKLIRQAYNEQSALGWNVLFRGFWSKSWRQAQEQHFRSFQIRESQDNGEQWAARAQLWFYNTFFHLWKLRNNDEHGANPATQRAARMSKCARSILRLYNAGNDLPYAERHPFRDSMDDLLQQPVQMQELWITKTETYLRGAHHRQRDRTQCQPAITNFFTRLHG